MTWLSWAMAHAIGGLFTGMVVLFGAVGLTAGVNKVVDSRAQFVSTDSESGDVSTPSSYSIQVSVEEPKEVLPNQIYLVGEWENEEDFVKNKSESLIIFRYSGKNRVCLLAGSGPGLIPNQYKVVVLKIFRDGQPLRGRDIGSSVIGINEDSLVMVQGYAKYELVDGVKGEKEHTLRIVIEKPGLLARGIGFNNQCD